MPEKKITDDQIRETAYHMWKEAGGQHGSEMDYWLKAEQALKGAKAKKPTRKAAAKKPAAKNPAAKKPATRKPAAAKAASTSKSAAAKKPAARKTATRKTAAKPAPKAG